METPYITDRSLIGVIDTLTNLAYRDEEAALRATFENDPTVAFSLTAPAGAMLRSSRRPFTWFIRQNAATIAERLEEARNLTRTDGAERSVPLADLTTEPSWPVLTLTVQPAEAVAA